MKMVIAYCGECDFGAVYVAPAEPAWPRYAGSHRTKTGEHTRLLTKTAEYAGDPRDPLAILTWANGVLKAEKS